jgi:excisionase family DNA binding protein
MEENKQRRFYTVDEVHDMIDRTVTRTQIYRMVSRKEIPAKRIGNRILIDAHWVNDFLNAPYDKTAGSL